MGVIFRISDISLYVSLRRDLNLLSQKVEGLRSKVLIRPERANVFEDILCGCGAVLPMPAEDDDVRCHVCGNFIKHNVVTGEPSEFEGPDAVSFIHVISARKRAYVVGGFEARGKAVVIPSLAAEHNWRVEEIQRLTSKVEEKKHVLKRLEPKIPSWDDDKFVVVLDDWAGQPTLRFRRSGGCLYVELGEGLNIDNFGLRQVLDEIVEVAGAMEWRLEL